MGIFLGGAQSPSRRPKFIVASHNYPILDKHTQITFNRLSNPEGLSIFLINWLLGQQHTFNTD